MKKLLSIATLGASLIAAPLAAHASPITPITGTLGVTLTIPTDAPLFSTHPTSLTWTSASTGTGTPGTGNFSTVPASVPLSGDLTINFGSGLLGSSAGSPFTFTIGTLGTFTATTDVADLAVTTANHFENFDISGYFTPAGTLASSYSESSADVFFALSQSTTGGSTSTTGTFSLSTPSIIIPPYTPPPPPTVPEPSSLALLGTGLLGGVGVIRRRFKA